MIHLALALATALGLAACTSRGGGRGDPDLPDAGRFDAGPPADAGPLADAGPRPDAGPPPEDVLVYAHSRDTLFAFSPSTLVVSTIGPFTLPGGGVAPFMTDLAVDEMGRVYTVSDTALFSVDPETAVATQVGELALGTDRLFALTFLVRGELSASREVLLGATNEGYYYTIDTGTAAARRIGRYPDGWQSSGDIVSVSGLGTFATVRRGDVDTDVLVQMDFMGDGSSTMTVVGEIRDGTRTFRELFGLGYWGRVLYAFSNAGELIEIDRMTGAGTLVSVETGTSQFWGAGVTTIVPVLF